MISRLTEKDWLLSKREAEQILKGAEMQKIAGEMMLKRALKELDNYPNAEQKLHQGDKEREENHKKTEK